MEKFYTDKNEIVVFVDKAEYTKDIGKKLGTTDRPSESLIKRIVGKKHEYYGYKNYIKGTFEFDYITQSFDSILQKIGLERSENIFIILNKENGA